MKDRILFKTMKYSIILLFVTMITTMNIYAQQGITITGTVTDTHGEILPGVTVLLKGTSRGTVTEANGTYSLTVPDGNAILQFSYIGFSQQEIQAGNRTTIDVTLLEDTQTLDEVVVVGYGVQSKRKVTSSVATLSTEKVENIPSASIVNNLGGRIPGLIVTANGGGPNNFSTISIRGGGTPIVVIDGIVSDYNDFRNINPSDIDNISLLKDAAAAAVYGSRAGNGILMVTTKQGLKGISVKYDFGYVWSQPTTMAKKLSSYEIVKYTNEGYTNNGLEPLYSDDIVEKYRTQSDPYNYPNTDWQALALNDFAPELRHNLSISGGDENNKYYASFGYYDKGTLYIFDTNYTKTYNGRLQMTNNFDKIGLKTTTSVNAQLYDYRVPNSQYGSGYYFTWGHIQNQSPLTLAYNDLGKYYAIVDHPIVEIDPESGYDSQKFNTITGLFNAEWKVPGVEGFKLRSISNYRMYFYQRKAWMNTAPQYSLGSTTPLAKNAPRLEGNYSHTKSYTQQFLADYDRTFGDFSVGLLLGYEMFSYFSSGMNATRVNYQLDVDQWIAGPTANLTNGGSEAEEGRAAIIGRFKTDYKSRYLFEFSMRRDGSDWFPEGKRWGTFYSFSGGWMLSEEAFMANLKDRNIINMFKFRGSWGQIGLNEGLSRFEYIPGYNLNTNAYVVNGELVQSFTEGSLVSPDITWYTLQSANFGFDFESMNKYIFGSSKEHELFGSYDRALFGSFDYFYMRTTGYLASPSGATYTAPLGTSLPRIKTDGASRRAGVEALLGFRNSAGDFRYEVSANYTYFDTLWENNPNENESTLKNPYRRTTHQRGYYGIGYKCDGFYTSLEDIMNSPRLLSSVNLAPGDLKYKDINGDGIIDSSDQVRIGKNNTPRVNYGINVDLNYKGIFLNMQFMGTGGKNFMLGDVLRGSGGPYPFQTDYWTVSNTNAKYPRLSRGLSNGGNNGVDSDYWLADASFFRLKALQLGYDLKTVLLRKANFLSTARIILGGTNLFTVSKSMQYYYDPETSGGGNNYMYPIERTYSITFNLGF